MAARKIDKTSNFEYIFTICTLMTKPDEYKEMFDSFIEAGFTEEDCEYLIADNSVENNFDAYVGINRFLREAKGKYIIVCHQDVLLNYDKRAKLEQCIAEIEKLDNKWAVLGNAGGNNLYRVSMVISEMDRKVHRHGILPSKVHSLDENFLLLKASSNLAVSSDLWGYHFYGTDICVIAECLGYTSYAIDFHLLHKSSGKVDSSFHHLRKEFIEKYTSFFRGRYFRTTNTNFYISGNYSERWLKNIKFVKTIYRVVDKYRFKLFGRL